MYARSLPLMFAFGSLFPYFAFTGVVVADAGEEHPGRRFHVTPRDETSQRVIAALQTLYRYPTVRAHRTCVPVPFMGRVSVKHVFHVSSCVVLALFDFAALPFFRVVVGSAPYVVRSTEYSCFVRFLFRATASWHFALVSSLTFPLFPSDRCAYPCSCALICFLVVFSFFLSFCLSVFRSVGMMFGLQEKASAGGGGLLFRPVPL